MCVCVCEVDTVVKNKSELKTKIIFLDFWIGPSKPTATTHSKHTHAPHHTTNDYRLSPNHIWFSHEKLFTLANETKQTTKPSTPDTHTHSGRRQRLHFLCLCKIVFVAGACYYFVISFQERKKNKCKTLLFISTWFLCACPWVGHEKERETNHTYFVFSMDSLR